MIPPDPTPAAWHRHLGRRVATLWPVKMVGTMAWVAGFFWLYFWVMRHPAGGVVPTTMPVTTVDRWFSVHEWALVPYASLWFYAGLAPALSKDGEELLAYARSALLLCVAGLAVFWTFPTAVPSFHVDWQQYPALAFLKSRDGGTNAFPSLHVAFAVHSAAFIRFALRAVAAPLMVHALNVAWAVLVVWSVFATRQHVLVDVLGGLATGALVVWLAARGARGRRASAATAPAGLGPSAGSSAG